MDSLTQIALGSAVTVAVMGRRTAAWKAALWGGIAGTLPDLDALIDHGDAVLNMVLHRAESHALFFLTLAAPVLAWIAARCHGERDRLGRWWLALWLALITHPLLDTMTVYGTQLLQPFSDHPYGVGSVFIIDPAYTVPLIVGVVAALRAPTGLRWNLAGLALSTAYLGWSVVAQQQVERVARASLAAQGIAAERLLVTPAPFNTVLWRVVATTPTHYYEGHRSLLDAEPRIDWTRHDRGTALWPALQDNDRAQRIAAFSHGFYALDREDGRYFITDLRMGQEPNYVFRFDLGDGRAPVPAQGAGGRSDDLGAALDWLWRRTGGERLLPPGVPLSARVP